MKRSILPLILLAALAAPPVLAQRPLSLNLGGGASVPVGGLRDDANLGWHALAAIGLSSYMQPLGLRVDVAYNSFGSTDETRALSGALDVGSATLNFTYRLPMTNSPVSPYLIAGAGAYRTQCDGPTGCGDATTRYGWNAGLGFKFATPGLRTFIEARFHRTERGERKVQFFPATIGVTL